MDLDKGMKARVRPNIIEGEIIRQRFDEETGDKMLLLSWEDAEGEAHERWFAEGDLESAEPADSKTA